MGHIIVFRRGQKPVFSTRYDIYNDEFYKKITVGNVRKSLLFHLLDNGYDLLSIMRMLDIDPKNLNNYIDKEAVLDNDWYAAKEIESTKEHPMEQFINDIIS